MTIRKPTQDRQKEIVQTVRKLIVKCGSENVTVRRIAQEIEVSEGAIYKHFRSKRDILSFLIDDVENTLISDIDDSSGRRLDTLKVLENIVIEHISAIEQRQGVTFQVIAEIISLGDKKLNKKIAVVIEKYLARIEAILADGVNNGMVRADIDLKAAARLFFGMTQGLVDLWAINQYQFSLVARFKPLWAIYLKGITPPHKNPAPALEARPVSL